MPDKRIDGRGPSPKPLRGTNTSGRLSGPDRLLARIVAAGPNGLDGAADRSGATQLAARDLAVLRDDGRLFATDPGRARIARLAGGANGFLAQHATLGRRCVEAEGVAMETVVDLDESPLAWLARRKGRDGRPLLAAHEVAAGERLRADFTRGQMTPRVTANWGSAIGSGRRGGSGGSVDLTDVALAARERFGRAIDSVGPELAGALIDVCCLLKGMEEIEKTRGWPVRGGKLVLGLGLARLARHYGYGDVAGPERGGRLVGWGAPDSRPSIDG